MRAGFLRVGCFKADRAGSVRAGSVRAASVKAACLKAGSVRAGSLRPCHTLSESANVSCVRTALNNSVRAGSVTAEREGCVEAAL